MSSHWTRTAKKSTSNTRASGEQTSDTQALIQVPAKDFIFSQVSIVASVCLEPNSHFISPLTAKFVNANGDAWSNESLRANYPSFIGAWNFVNHVQEPAKSVGFIADAALRRIMLDADTRTSNYYVDLLVATSREHEQLVKRISTSEIEFLSMGCNVMHSTCSACGHRCENEGDECEHVASQKGKYFIDGRGVKRITADLLGDDKPGSCIFEEASWLTEPPAFGGACKRNLLAIPSDHTIQLHVPAASLEREAMKKYLRS